MSKATSAEYEECLMRADDSFLIGDSVKAAELYSLSYDVLQKNGNTGCSSLTNSSWASEYFDSQLFEIEQKILMFPMESSYYLDKAAVYFFQNKWEEARDVLSEANSKCSDKSKIRYTIGQLNKLERKIDATKP